MRIKGKCNVVFKPEQREFTHFAERSNEKELNNEITLLYSFLIVFWLLENGYYHIFIGFR